MCRRGCAGLENDHGESDCCRYLLSAKLFIAIKGDWIVFKSASFPTWSWTAHSALSFCTKVVILFLTLFVFFQSPFLFSFFLKSFSQPFRFVKLMQDDIQQVIAADASCEANRNGDDWDGESDLHPGNPSWTIAQYEADYFNLRDARRFSATFSDERNARIWSAWYAMRYWYGRMGAASDVVEVMVIRIIQPGWPAWYSIRALRWQTKVFAKFSSFSSSIRRFPTHGRLQFGLFQASLRSTILGLRCDYLVARAAFWRSQSAVFAEFAIYWLA